MAARSRRWLAADRWRSSSSPGWAGSWSSPCPTAREPRGAIRALDLLLLKAFPEVVPGIDVSTSRTSARPCDELSHVENLPAAAADRRWPPALIAAAALGAGRAGPAPACGCATALGRRERLALDFGLGTAGLGVLTLVAGRLGLLDPWLVPGRPGG